MRRIQVLILIFLIFLSGCGVKQPTEAWDEVRVSYIDVGQGDCTLISSAYGNVLIDSGEREYFSTVDSYLKKAGVKKLDYIIATHPHSDHIGGMSQIIKVYEGDSVIFPEAVSNTATYLRFLEAVEERGLNVIRPVPGESFALGDVKFTILAPNSESYEELNNYSVVVKMEYGNTSFLFTGDQEVLSEKETLENGLDLSADVLKLGHHGSSTSSCEAFLDAVNPTVAVISCGKNNSYGHPTKEVTDRLEEREIRILRTDLKGTILLVTDGATISYNGGEKENDTASRHKEHKFFHCVAQKPATPLKLTKKFMTV